MIVKNLKLLFENAIALEQYVIKLFCSKRTQASAKQLSHIVQVRLQNDNSIDEFVS